MAVRNDKLVMVCDRCFRASCWYGEFMCDDAQGAGLVVMAVGDLRKLGRENADFWTDKKFFDVYGEAKPQFRERRITLADARRDITDTDAA